MRTLICYTSTRLRMRSLTFLAAAMVAASSVLGSRPQLSVRVICYTSIRLRMRSLTFLAVSRLAAAAMVAASSVLGSWPQLSVRVSRYAAMSVSSTNCSTYITSVNIKYLHLRKFHINFFIDLPQIFKIKSPYLHPATICIVEFSSFYLFYVPPYQQYSPTYCIAHLPTLPPTYLFT